MWADMPTGEKSIVLWDEHRRNWGHLVVSHTSPLFLLHGDCQRRSPLVLEEQRDKEKC